MPSSDGGQSKSLTFNLTNAYFNLGWGIAAFRAGEDGTLEFQNGGTWTAVGGQAWGDLFNYVEITFSGMGGASIWLDSLIIGAKAIPRWSFSTDGTDPSILNIIAPAFAANGWTFTAFIDGDPGIVSAFAPTAKIRIDKYGAKIGVMGLTLTDYNTNGRNIGTDWDTCVANFLANRLPAPKVFAYPQNSASRANDAILMNRGVVWRRAGGNPVLHNVGFGKPGGYDSMVRQGCNGYTDGNFDKGPNPHLYIANRYKMLALTGGVEHEFPHNERYGLYDSLGSDASDFYRACDMKKSMEFTDGLENIDCEKTSEILDAERFY